MSDAGSAPRAKAPPLPENKSDIDVTKTHAVAEFKHDFPLTTCRIDPTGKYVFAGAEDFNVYRWEIDGGPDTKTVLTGHNSWVRSLDFTPDGEWLFTGGYDDHIGVWKVADELPEPAHMLKAHKGWVRWVRVREDGRFLASCGNDNLVKLWNLPDGTLYKEFAGHDRYPYAVEFHPDGRRIVSFDLMGVIREWDIETGKPLRKFEAKFMWGFDQKFRADMGGARDMRFSPDGKTLAVAGLSEVTNAFAGVHKPTILVYDWEKGEPRQKMVDKSMSGLAWGVRFHPHGFLIGCGAPQGGNKGVLWFWKIGQEKPFHTVKLSHCGRGIDLTPDARRIAVAQFDNTLRVYQMTAKTADA